MQYILSWLPVLACPVGMGLMMWFMMRGNNAAATTPVQPDPNTQEEIAVLRAEIATLRAQSGQVHNTSDGAA